jgi:hypothetical protein
VLIEPQVVSIDHYRTRAGGVRAQPQQRPVMIETEATAHSRDGLQPFHDQEARDA